MGLAEIVPPRGGRRRRGVSAPVWSQWQAQCLAAMGLTLYRQATAAPVEVVEIDFEDPLFPAIIRAAGVMPARPSEFDWDGWARGVRLPALAELRRDPASKRALWPRLRRWRKEHPSG
jgi:hypothetical protein